MMEATGLLSGREVRCDLLKHERCKEKLMGTEWPPSPSVRAPKVEGGLCDQRWRVNVRAI